MGIALWPFQPLRRCASRQANRRRLLRPAWPSWRGRRARACGPLASASTKPLPIPLEGGNAPPGAGARRGDQGAVPWGVCFEDADVRMEGGTCPVISSIL